MIFLFTDFGAADLYVGQVKAALHRHAPGTAVIDLLHAAPAFNRRASAHLLAALSQELSAGSVTMAVVDPGVGGARRAVAVLAEDRWFVGPDNGLLSVIAARTAAAEVFDIGWRPAGLSASFHGRDLFAPVAAMLARADRRAVNLERKPALDENFGGDDLPEVIYVDHYGNAMTGLRAGAVPPQGRLRAQGRLLERSRVFSDVPPGRCFWYINSLGLAEIAANGASAAALLDLAAGTAVTVDAG